MLHRLFSRSVMGIALCALSLTFMAGSSVSAADGQTGGRVVKRVRAKGRLPNYYADVVTEKQREEILKIQEEYKPKLDALQAQLDALKKERNEKISGVLTADQKKKVEDAEAAAKAKKKTDEKKDEPAKPAENAEKAEK
jgi:hypothetical protein